jgi:hypothetical protein
MPNPTPEQHAQVKTWIVSWAKCLHLEHYTIEIKFFNRRSPDDKKEDITTFADTQSQYAGLEAEVRVWKPFWLLEELQQEKVCLHELVHIILPNSSEDEVCRVTEVVWKLVKGV